MAGIFNAIGSLFGGGGGGGGYIYTPQPYDPGPPPAAPAPVAPPPTTRDVQGEADIAASAYGVANRGPASTVLTGGLGDTSAYTTAKKRLLGG